MPSACVLHPPAHTSCSCPRAAGDPFGSVRGQAESSQQELGDRPETTAGGCWLDQSKVKYRLVPERRFGIRQRKLNVCDPADSDRGM